ncbi:MULTISPECIES: hypothetical protein [Archaeoglobus]|jgi:hypothetical protein|uniref:Uncharacterized protein n=3 Tax=Archaeoglobus fulgidus TaxID=2234 RepID=O30221_ARCFU|nr:MULTISPECIES: hypothetical protein [Archaeoglobus]AAB91215.1 predicted coding region AF_0014 [Archaeoglobus fulgidus DSM 4304]AIG96858.1 hypothetical protein AFULGI_00000120 [Archaeoglobus fulgidus DSM 8774]KUJ94564.1 MAG: hypothetical protein XD40_0128 [Archaeoglobus fulgidus]KUK06026.1 MAG: hypothetical protein XD48_1732 [Archaeoglobus fulgidus]MDI3497622.1 hypothetical protein [Archaeoglobus sp.]
MEARDSVIYLQTAIVGAMLFAAFANSWRAFLYLAAVNISLWLFLGLYREDRARFAAVFSLIVLAIMLVGKTLILYYYDVYYGSIPEFVAGMHPGMFVMVVMFFVLYIVPVGYALFFDRILPEDDWKKFVERYRYEEG